MSHLITVFLVLVASASLQAQTLITGQVIDNKKQPVLGASLTIKGSYDGATADSSGKFRFKTFEKGSQILVVSNIGFKTVEIPITITGTEMNIPVQLKQEITEMSAVVISAGAFEASDRKQPAKKVDQLLNSVVEIAGLIRSIGASLRPSILDTMGLVPVLKWQADEFAKNSGLKIYFNAPISTSNINISDKISIGIYRIFQEAINNVLKHAKATEVVVNLAIDEQRLILRIIDNGIGFQRKEKKPGDSFSMGLLSMQERCAMIKGNLMIDSEPGEGTIIELSIPLNSKTENPLHA